jgi:hypothetical protein
VNEPIDYFEGQEANPEQEAATLELLGKLGVEARALEVDIAADTVLLEEKKGLLNKILMDRIPTIMEQLGMESFKLTSGETIVVKSDIKCGISEERKPAALAWLRAGNYDGIIKQTVELSFGKGESAEAKKAMDTLHEAGFDPAVSEGVHPQTLKSFVKECLEKAVNIPLETFGVFDFKIAKITLPKTRK